MKNHFQKTPGAAVAAWALTAGLILSGCEFNLNTVAKEKALPATAAAKVFNAPNVPKRALDATGQANFIVVSDLWVDANNYAQVRAALSVIKQQAPNVPILVLGGFTKSGSTQDIAWVAQLRNEFHISGFTFGPGDPLQGSSNDGARRLCSALVASDYSAVAADPNHYCSVANARGTYDFRAGASSDYDYSPHHSTWLMDTRPASTGGAGAWKFQNASGHVDANTQLYGFCASHYRSFYSDADNRLGYTTPSTVVVDGVVSYQRMPVAVGTHRMVPMFFAADPFRGNSMEPASASALRLALGNSLGVPVVFTRSMPGGARSEDAAVTDAGYLVPMQVNLGKKSVWNVQVGMLNPVSAGSSQAPAYTEVFLGHSTLLVKQRSAVSGDVLSSHALDFSSEHQDRRWRSGPRAEGSPDVVVPGSYAMCCQIDLGLRSADGSNTLRTLPYATLLANPFASFCGDIR